MAEITLRGLSKRFSDGTLAVRDLDLDIRDGEVFVLVGPSGCGKSTLLEMIVGLTEPTTGRILVDGTDVTTVDPRHRNMAMVFQSYALYPHMTVRENMEFPLRMARVEEEEMARRVGEAAGILGLEDLLDRQPRALSGGQRQRVAMGRAIVRQPVAFLLDEPLSNLDAKLRSQMRTELGRIQRRLGTTMVYVTHDQAEAMTLGDQIAILRNGILQQVGSPRELYGEPQNLFVAAFMGSPPANFLPARIKGRSLSLPMLDMDVPEHLQIAREDGGGEYIAAVRPEGLIQENRGDDPENGGAQPSFTIQTDLVEWMGADLFVHFRVGPGGRELDRISRGTRAAIRELDLGDPGEGKWRGTARLPAGAPVRENEGIRLRIDPAAVMLFHPETGTRVG